MSAALATFEDHWKETIRLRKASLSKTAVAHELEKYQDSYVFPSTSQSIPNVLKHAVRKIPYRFQDAFPWPLIVLIVCGYAIGVACVVTGPMFFSDEEDKDSEGNKAAAISILALGFVVFVILGVVINLFKQRTSLKGHIQALHFVYMKDNMPVVGGNRDVVYEIKVKEVVSCNKVRWVLLVLYADGTWTEQPDCCAW